MYMHIYSFSVLFKRLSVQKPWQQNRIGVLEWDRHQIPLKWSLLSLLWFLMYNIRKSPAFPLQSKIVKHFNDFYFQHHLAFISWEHFPKGTLFFTFSFKLQLTSVFSRKDVGKNPINISVTETSETRCSLTFSWCPACTWLRRWRQILGSRSGSRCLSQEKVDWHGPPHELHMWNRPAHCPEKHLCPLLFGSC